MGEPARGDEVKGFHVDIRGRNDVAGDPAGQVCDGNLERLGQGELATTNFEGAAEYAGLGRIDGHCAKLPPRTRTFRTVPNIWRMPIGP